MDILFNTITSIGQTLIGIIVLCTIIYLYIKITDLIDGDIFFGIVTIIIIIAFITVGGLAVSKIIFGG